LKLEQLKKHRRRSRLLNGIFGRNPVFVGGMALPLVIIATTNLKNAAAISLLVACATLPAVLFASVLGQRMPDWAAPPFYALFTMILVLTSVPVLGLISPEVTDSLGIYTALVSVNTMTLSLCSHHAGDQANPLLALIDGVTYSIGFALAALLVAALREAFGTNTIWGVPLKLPFRIYGLQLAYSGFILVALLSACFRFLRRLAYQLLYRHENPFSEETS
jgi:electron transport complex protein RnfE